MKHSILSIVIVAPLIVGCASKGEDYGETIDTHENKGITFSADIDESSEGWRFNNIQRGASGAVNLDDLYPTNVPYSSDSESDNSDSTSECMKGFWGLTEGTCRAPDFGKSDVTIGQVAASPIMVPFVQTVFLIGVPMTAIAGELPNHLLEQPDSLILPFPANLTFDWNEYWNAIEEAKKREDFYKRFSSYYYDFVELENLKKDYSEPDIVKSNKDEIIEKAKNAYLDEKKKRHELAAGELQINVVDNSGLIAASVYDDYELSASLDKQDSDRIVNEFHEELDSKPNPEFSRVSPYFMRKAKFQNVNEMSAAIEEGRKHYYKKRSKNQEVATSHNEEVMKSNDGNNEKLADLNKNIDLRAFVFESDHEEVAESKFDDFNLSFESTEPLEVNSDGTVENFDKTVFIDSFNLHHTFNPVIEQSDQVIDITLSNNVLEIKNTTDEFVTIDSISLYNQGEINTKSGDSFSDLELLPPRSENTESMQSFGSDGLTVWKNDLLAEEARQTYYDYGLVIRYRVSGENGENIMDEVQEFNLLSLIEQELYTRQ